MSFSRREFLHTGTSAALAAGLVTKIPLKGLGYRAPEDFIPEPDEPYLRDLAVKAMEAARAAGATFADIRLTVGRYFSTGGFAERDRQEPMMVEPAIGFPVRYGIRAHVDGAWGFAAETALSADIITAVARKAVIVAKANRTRKRTRVELAPTPVVPNGEWSTPIEQDPLKVPLHQIGEVAVAMTEAAYKFPESVQIVISLSWRRPTTIFASTEGSVITQRYCYSSLGGEIITKGGSGGVSLRNGPFGYEALEADTVVAKTTESTRKALTAGSDWDQSKYQPVETGRYDIVLAPGPAASLVSGTISGALAASYALGYEMNGGGISFASPPLDMLGKYQIASPLITVRCDRTRPKGSATVGWDEEGVKPDKYTLVERGIIMDYHTDRQTGAELAPWYQKRGEAARSHGCARQNGTNIPVALMPNMTLEPGAEEASTDDLVRGVKKGIYFEHINGETDQQTLSGQFYTRKAFEIKNGKVGPRLRDIAMQFTMPHVWKSVDAIGGRASSVTMNVGSDALANQDPTQPFPVSSFDSVPVRIRGVNVMNITKDLHSYITGRSTS